MTQGGPRGGARGTSSQRQKDAHCLSPRPRRAGAGCRRWGRGWQSCLVRMEFRLSRWKVLEAAATGHQRGRACRCRAAHCDGVRISFMRCAFQHNLKSSSSPVRTESHTGDIAAAGSASPPTGPAGAPGVARTSPCTRDLAT